nr:divalent-cation tolerance protein CutA [Streptomyces chartreusis]
MTKASGFVCAVSITSPDERRLIGICQALLSERLCACLHDLVPLTSTYWWDGQINTRKEFSVVLHTRSDLVSSIVDRVTEVHPYQVPCIVSTPLQGGNPDYLDWIRRETAPSKE